MKLTITKADRDDLKRILNLQKECFSIEGELYGEDNVPPLHQTIESVEEEFSNGTVFLKCVFEDQIIASVRGKIEDNIAYIGKLVVRKDFQNKGIGQLMMSSIEAELNNCSRYELFTGHKSDKNQHLYSKIGYNEFRKRSINNRLTLIYMEKIKG